jgi:predicted nucleic acid-binding protein
MKKPPVLRLYLDTSVFGGVFDVEFETDSQRIITAVHKKMAIVMISDVVLDEVVDAPANVKKLVDDLPEGQLVRVEVTDEVKKLRDGYLARKILTQKSLDDATHVALATINRADAIVSWNFKHIVRLDKMKQYNQVNFSFGYGILGIVSPKEVLFDEEKE